MNMRLHGASLVWVFTAAFDYTVTRPDHLGHFYAALADLWPLCSEWAREDLRMHLKSQIAQMQKSAALDPQNKYYLDLIQRKLQEST